MFTLGPFDLSSANTQPVKFNPTANNANGSAQPVIGVVLQNLANGFVIVESGATSTVVAPFSAFPIQFPTPTLSASPIIISSAETIAGNLLVTVFQQGDSFPHVAIQPSTTEVSISNGTVNVGSGTIDANISGGTVDIGSGTINVGNVLSSSSTETQKANDAYSIVPPASTVTEFPNTASSAPYIYLGTLSVVNPTANPAEIHILNGAGVIYFASMVQPGTWATQLIDCLMYNSAPFGIYAFSNQNPVRLTITSNITPTIHST